MEFSEKQIQIIEVTEKLFAEKGYEGTSVRDIAHVAGVNVAMISYYFGSKEKLFQAVFAHRISLSKLRLESLLHDKTLTPAEKLDQMIEGYIDKIIQNPNFHRIVINKEMKDITCILHDNKLQNMELVRKIIQEGQKKKDFVKHVDVPMLMVTMIGTTTYLINNQDLYRKLYQQDDMTDAEYMETLRKKLYTHIKLVFKSILIYEGK